MGGGGERTRSRREVEAVVLSGKVDLMHGPLAGNTCEACSSGPEGPAKAFGPAGSEGDRTGLNWIEPREPRTLPRCFPYASQCEFRGSSLKENLI